MHESDISVSTQKILEKCATSKKPVVIMGIGIPASGKSTLLDDVAWKAGPNIYTIDTDAIRDRLIKLRSGSALNNLLRQEIYLQVSDSIGHSGIAIVDGTNILRNDREMDTQQFREMGVLTIGAVFLDIEESIAQQRNSTRQVPVTPQCIQQMNFQLEQNRPSLQEGFEWIITAGSEGLHTDMVLE